MTKIKKHTINNLNYFSAGVPEKQVSDVKFIVNGDNDYFELKIVQYFTDNTELVVLWNKVLATNIKQFGVGADFVAYGVNPHMHLVADNDGVPTGPYILKPYEFIDIFSETLSSRSRPSLDAVYNNYPYYIFVDDQNSDFSTWTVVLKIPENVNYIFEGNLKTAVETATTITKFGDHLPGITLSSSATSVAPNSSVVITINTDPSVKEIFLDAVYGLLNKQRAIITNGTGTVTAYSTDMATGENVRVRAGFKRFPSKEQIIIPVE